MPIWIDRLTLPGMMAHYFAYLVNCIPLGSLTFFTPTIVTGLGFDSIKAQLMTVPPWVLGYFFSLFLGWSADRHNARGMHIFCSSLLGAIGWVTAGSLPADAYTKRYVMLFFCACGAFPSSGPLSAWVTCNVPAFTTLAIATASKSTTRYGTPHSHADRLCSSEQQHGRHQSDYRTVDLATKRGIHGIPYGQLRLRSLQLRHRPRRARNEIELWQDEQERDEGCTWERQDLVTLMY